MNSTPTHASLRVAAYTGGVSDPSARFRIRQQMNPLRAHGISVTEFPAWLGSYPPPARSLRPFWGAATLAERTIQALRSRTYDVTILQREMIATLCTAERLTARPRILDVDDAIWLHGNGSCAEKLARCSDLVICGNAYLADRFSRWNRRVAVLPTAIDTRRFAPAPHASVPARPPVIGWSGSSSGFRFLAPVAKAIASTLDRVPGARFRVIADRPPTMPELAGRIDFVPWSVESEVAALQGLSVGIMPLDDSDWARAKCAFKLLAYLACGLPVVASPVGMNTGLLAAVGGLAPRNEEEWMDSLMLALTDLPWRETAGLGGRTFVEREFSLPALTPRLAALLRGSL